MKELFLSESFIKIIIIITKNIFLKKLKKIFSVLIPLTWVAAVFVILSAMWSLISSTDCPTDSDDAQPFFCNQNWNQLFATIKLEFAFPCLGRPPWREIVDEDRKLLLYVVAENGQYDFTIIRDIYTWRASRRTTLQISLRIHRSLSANLDDPLVPSTALHLLRCPPGGAPPRTLSNAKLSSSCYKATLNLRDIHHPSSPSLLFHFVYITY